VVINRGKIEQIDYGSGHYKPRPLQMLHCLQALVAHGVSLRAINVQPFGTERWVNAAKFLSSGGRNC
jgi:hypothetical protein